MAETSYQDILQGHYARTLHAAEGRMEDTDLARGRARDTALHGLKVVEAISAYELLVSNDPQQAMGWNSAVRIPTTLDHPNAVVGKG